MTSIALRVGWWMRDLAYAANVQWRATFSRIDPRSYETPSPSAARRPPVLLIPGVFETWHFLRPVAALLHERGHPVFVVPDLGRNTAGVAASAGVVADFLDQRGLADIVAVVHSKGGLIAKYLMVHEPGRIRHTAAICAPFAGSRYARWAPTPTLRVFSPRNESMRILAANLEANTRITSLYSAFDPLIPEGSELVGARNVRLPVHGHFRILSSRALAAALLTTLQQID